MHLKEVCNIMSAHFTSKAKQITCFAQSGYSFEEWINWELFTAFTEQGFSTHPKPAYKAHFQENSSALLGDILVCDEAGEQLFIEVAVVHSYTQDKWRAKLLDDRAKLKGLSSSSANTRKIQLVISCASNEKDLQKNWNYWYTELLFWNELSETLVLDDGADGEIFMKIWEVE
ncbi:hypothetical protein [Azotobacter chroococcum]|uniref:hypothetical protein n=1 Tax=Azotobacter chroococcum TaxID=353 RepID=UPI001186654E|nr:hypothetical protein [Azotobacter chroococcum]